ncbi:MAG: hypothetical protein GX470_07710 [Lentimicrobium sp.]|jgi:hypothetical protein|nr:hypothetical protein [Lentimicrobium sp.]
MNPEKINQIVPKIYKQIIETLVKLEPDFRRLESDVQPNYTKLSYLIEQSLPVLFKAGQSELKQLLELSKLAKQHFKLKYNKKIFATDFILINQATVNNLLYEFQTCEIHEYFTNKYYQLFKVWRTSETESFLNSISLDQWVPGFSVNTFVKFYAVRKFDGNIEIQRQYITGENEQMIVFDEVKKELSEQSLYYQKTFVEQFKKDWSYKEINSWLKSEEKAFLKFSLMVRDRYDKLRNNFDSLIEILNIEIEQRKNSPPASYIRLPIKDEKKRQEFISFVYFGLNGRCFETTKENFEKIFTPDKSFTKIKWKLKPNTFVHLFTGFESLNIDGFDISFPGIADPNTPDIWTTLSDKFDFDFKGNTPANERLAIIKRKQQVPRDLKNFITFISGLKGLSK